jgi:hypothetical protein
MSEPLTLTDVIHKARHQYEGEERHIFCGDIAQEVERWLAARVAPSDGLQEALAAALASDEYNADPSAYDLAKADRILAHPRLRAALATTGQPVDGLREAAHCDDHIVYQGACWKCLERAALATTGPEDTRTADPGGLREARTVASLEMLADERFHGSMCDMAAYCSCGMTQNLINVEREAAVLTPEATAPDEEGAKP